MKYSENRSATIEFSETLSQENKLIRILVSFCNSKGGKLIIGVKKNGQITGLTEEEIDYALEHLARKISKVTSPPIVAQIYTQTIDAKTILVIEVPSGMNKPYFITKEGLEQGVYIRASNEITTATSDKIEELKWESQRLSYDTFPVLHASLKDLDLEQFSEFLKKRSEAFLAIDEALQTYQLVTQVHAHTYPTVAGILLFGHNPQTFFPDALIECTSVAISGDTLSSRVCKGTLFEQYHEAYAFVVSQLYRSFTIETSIRSEKYELPEKAVQEAIVNALIHRNYHEKEPIKILISSDRVEIISPGNFYNMIDESKVIKGISCARNTSLAKVFRDYSGGRTGGIPTIFLSYEEWGLKEPKIIESVNTINCILPRRGPAHSPLVPGDYQKKQILDLFDVATDISIGDIISTLRIPRTTAGRKLSQLTKEGLIKKIGKGSGTLYVRTNKK